MADARIVNKTLTNFLQRSNKSKLCVTNLPVKTLSQVVHPVWEGLQESVPTVPETYVAAQADLGLNRTHTLKRKRKFLAQTEHKVARRNLTGN